MRKIVINICYGGFGLSDEAVYAYARRKGLKLYPEDIGHGLMMWYTKPKEERPVPLENWYMQPLEVRQAFNKAEGEACINTSGIPRDDTDLVALVEELGARAHGRSAELKVVEIPDDVEWTIEEYDGCEWVAEKHRTWD